MLEWPVIAGAAGALLSLAGGAMLGRAQAGTQFKSALRSAEGEASNATRALEMRLSTEQARAATSEVKLRALMDTLGLAPLDNAEATLLADAWLASGAGVATIADSEGLVRSFKGPHELAESLASLAPDALPLLGVADQLVLRGVLGGEVRAMRLASSDARLLLLGSNTRPVSAEALRMAQARALFVVDVEASSTPMMKLACVEDESLHACCAELGLRWLARLEADHVAVGGAWTEETAAFAVALQRIARRAPGGFAAPLSTVEIRHRAGCVVLALGANTSFTFASESLRDDAAAVPRMGTLIARRMNTRGRPV